MATQTSEIVIEELGGRKRALTLRGAGLPKKGADWSGKQRLATTWYPGNAASATQQVVGPIDPPSQWNGEWNTTRLVVLPPDLDGDPIVYAHDLALTLEDILRAGAQLRVTWSTQLSVREGPRTIVRLGRASDWRFPYDTIDDIVAWSITWEWMGRGLPQAKVSIADNAREAALFRTQQAAAALRESEQLHEMITAHQQIPNGTTPSLLGQLEALADEPQRIFRQVSQAALLIENRCQRIGALIDKTRGLPFEIAGQAVDVFRNAQAVANQFVDSMSRRPPEQNSLDGKLASVTRAATYFGDGVRQSQYLSRQANDAEEAMRAQQLAALRTGENGVASQTQGLKSATGAAFEVYITRQGDTLLSVALKFYGAGFEGAGQQAIATANALRLGTTTLPVGLTLMIPTVALGGAPQIPKPWVPMATELDVAPGGLTTEPGLFP